MILKTSLQNTLIFCRHCDLRGKTIRAGQNLNSIFNEPRYAMRCSLHYLNWVKVYQLKLMYSSIKFTLSEINHQLIQSTSWKGKSRSYQQKQNSKKDLETDYAKTARGIFCNLKHHKLQEYLGKLAICWRSDTFGQFLHQAAFYPRFL